MGDRAAPHLKRRLIAISASLAVGLGLMVVKFVAFWITNSAAILSDALESIINVVAAAFALWSIIFASSSPDLEHPYGHGKMEYFAAGFEGALIILAALGIFYEAWPRLFHPQAIPRLAGGLNLIVAAAVINLILGLALITVGKRTASLVLVADGKHVLTDVLTTLGVVAGLLGVMVTGWYWLDGGVAVLVACNILITGAGLVHQSSAALLDTSEPGLLSEICQVITAHRRDLWIDVHQLRARRAGDHVFIDFHLILPRDLSLEASHEEVKKLQAILLDHFEGRADILIHADPCTLPECPICGRTPCEHRQGGQKMQRLWTKEALTSADHPAAWPPAAPAEK